MTSADHLAKLLRERAEKRLNERLDAAFKPIGHFSRPPSMKTKVRYKDEYVAIDTWDTLMSIKRGIFNEMIAREVETVTKEFVDAVDRVDDLRADLENHNHG
jgi:hypothetical protein